MSRRLLFMMVLAVSVIGLAGVAAARSLPSGERINGGNGARGGTVLEPVYDDMTGAIRYVSTPRGIPSAPVNTNPRATAPFYLPVYPTGATVGTLNCQDVPVENCPDHGAAVAAAAEAINPGGVYTGGVIGHDHLMAGPGSGGELNVAWVPTLVLFTNSAAANTHPTLLSQINALVANHDAILVPLDGTNGTPNLTFHCSVASAAVYDHSVPFTG